MSNKDQIILTDKELDVIGEIMNISMGAAATSVSSMLEKQVTITTPHLEQEEFSQVDCSELEPAVVVRIRYVEGLTGENVIMFRRRDMQVILNLLMGNEYTGDDDDFEFDEMSMSAACEVMNQMMGASSTALSEILGFPINISTPEASLEDTKTSVNGAFNGIKDDENVVSISFKMMIKDVLDTTFASFMPTKLVSEIVGHVVQDMDTPPQEVPIQPAQPSVTIPESAVQESVPTPQVPPVSPVMDTPTSAAQEPVHTTVESNHSVPEPQPPQTVPGYVPPQTPPPVQQTAQPSAQQYAQPPQQPAMQQPVENTPQGQPSMGYPPYGYMPQQGQPYMQNPYMMPPMGYSPYGYMPQQPQQPKQINVQKAEFPNFSFPTTPVVPSSTNMNLLMGVQLDVSVVIGKAKRKVKDILEFGQGTVVELDKQTGSPAEIVVNGQLLAYGDVIVVGDNFGIRITEIVGSQELLDSLQSGDNK